MDISFTSDQQAQIEALAAYRGLRTEQVVQEAVQRVLESDLPLAADRNTPALPTRKSIADLFASVRGDDLDFSHTPSIDRPIEL